MENKRSPKGLEAFFAGKGFYIVLSLCVVIIGVTAWAMLSRAGTDADTPANGDYADYVDLEDYSAAEFTPSAPDAAQPPETESGGPLQSEDAPAGSGDATGSTDTASPVELQEQPVLPVWNTSDPELITQQAFYWPVNGVIENPYSVDALVFNRTMSDWRTHEGVDIAADLGTQVMAAGSGRVESIYTDDLYGITVVIDHMGGLKSVYSNLADQPTVAVGDSLVAGDIIGAVGTSALGETGEVTHLHFAMTLDGQSVDPTEYLP